VTDSFAVEIEQVVVAAAAEDTDAVGDNYSDVVEEWDNCSVVVRTVVAAVEPGTDCSVVQGIVAQDCYILADSVPYQEE
jgi:hypothetical protein